ncbi:MAG: NAD(P)H-hydrate dehydratase [Kiritimatiellaeota bacterium]|nr:NAD(P)H-hydrate dehydratase [Kiritimatiellota bacterium]
MRYVTTAEIQELDRRMTTEVGVSHSALVERAGLRVAECARRLARVTGVEALPMVVLAGKGTNGADAKAATEFLRSWRYTVQCVEIETEPLPEAVFPEGTIFVDGILGTGARGAPRAKAAEAIRWLNERNGAVIAIDIPSGMDADTGTCHDPCVTATLTVCMALPKTGFKNREARAKCGRVEIADIGFPQAWWTDGDAMAPGVIAEAEMKRLLPPRPREGHKGTFGFAGIVAGSETLSGAAVLAASGALKSGAGLVSAWTLAETLPGMPPEVMVRRGMPELARLMGKATALTVGPGLGTSEAARLAVRLCLASDLPLVLDADGLNLCADDPTTIRRAAPTVITPHPGEAARLLPSEPSLRDGEGRFHPSLHCTVAEIQADREAAVRRLVELTHCTVILKGADTLIASPNTGTQLLIAGNPGMATGGTGDVLAGLVGGLLAQGLPPFDAARLGAWLHATAGDLAAWRNSPPLLTASDLLRHL